MNIVLYQPEIPYNTGNIGRTAVLTGSSLHIIKPMGFSLDEKQIKRAGLDYWSLVDLHIWESIEELWSAYPNNNFYYATTKTKQSYSDVKYKQDDFIVLGPESRGIPEEILNKFKENNITIPMKKIGRSLNLSNSAAIIIFEAYRQCDFNFGE